MALSEKELKDINRHCTCGKPNFVFIKFYKWRNNNEKWLRSAGTFHFCNDPICLFYFKNFLQINVINSNDIMGNEHYYVATGFTLDNLPNVLSVDKKL